MKFLPACATTVLACAILLTPKAALAHCDTVDGPVVAAATRALAAGDVAPVLKWVKPENEPQIRAAFAQALKVRGLGEEARRLADQYFFETLVRVHRAGEGAPFDGIKPAGTPVDPGIAAADTALASGSIDEAAAHLAAAVADGVRQRFARVQSAAKNADRDVSSGREYVAAYVEFIHYVEALQQAASPHHAESAAHVHGGGE
jgi:hypothetical protein